MRRRATRLLVGTVLGCLTIAAPAQARYLHLSEGRRGAEAWARLRASDETDRVEVHSCSRVTAHVVRCEYQEGAYSDYPYGTVSSVIIRLRGRQLWGHQEGPDRPRLVGHV